MKNRILNYNGKASNISQINGIIERKKSIDTEILYEKTMAELQTIYWREKELLIAIPILIQTATTFELVETLTVLNKYTREHIEQLEMKFPNIDKVNELKKYDNELQKKYE